MNLIDKLWEGPIDIIGDIHGEIAALDKLLDRLGYDHEGRHSGNRRLVFVGDLVDRGPDSPAVIRRVQQLVDTERAQCVLGNHELNILRQSKKHGNEWFTAPEVDTHYPAERVSGQEHKTQILDFFGRLPLALHRDDLRVVHASWQPEAIERIQNAQRENLSVLDVYEQDQRSTQADLKSSGTLDSYEEEKHDFGPLISDDTKPVPFLPAHARVDAAKQMGNSVKVLTSGQERPVPSKKPFWAGGKWRMVERVRWWLDYVDPARIIMGHYWRPLSTEQTEFNDKFGPNLFEDVAHDAWLGTAERVYCADFCVGYRHRARDSGVPESIGKLAAVRVPEWRVACDDGDEWSLRN